MRKAGRWQVAYFCINCDAEVSKFERIYNDGMCPHCAYKGPNAATIMDTYAKSFRLVTIHPWWKVWKIRAIREFANEDGVRAATGTPSTAAAQIDELRTRVEHMQRVVDQICLYLNVNAPDHERDPEVILEDEERYNPFEAGGPAIGSYTPEPRFPMSELFKNRNGSEAKHPRSGEFREGLILPRDDDGR